MEYTIYNESLVKYMLRDPISGLYYHFGAFSGAVGLNIAQADRFNTIKEAEDARRFACEQDKKLKDLQIRKVKVIDIGEVNENI